jgi:hypothetical protein
MSAVNKIKIKIDEDELMSEEEIRKPKKKTRKRKASTKATAKAKKTTNKPATKKTTKSTKTTKKKTTIKKPARKKEKETKGGLKSESVVEKKEDQETPGGIAAEAQKLNEEKSSQDIVMEAIKKEGEKVKETPEEEKNEEESITPEATGVTMATGGPVTDITPGLASRDKIKIVDEDSMTPEELEKFKEERKKARLAAQAQESNEVEDANTKEENDQVEKKAHAVKDMVKTELKQEHDKEIEEIAKTKVKSRRSIRLYKKIALIFSLCTIVLIAVIAYFMLVKVTIVLIPNQERKSSNLIFDIYDIDKNEAIEDSAVKGIVKLVTIDEVADYQTSGAKVIGEEAVGTVTIINNYTKNQPLVATTRLLTPDSRLYRIDETVNVPAGGSVEVGIYADDPSEEMSIEGPMKFTIPGLWAGLQDQIFAEIKDNVVYQEKLEKSIVQEDIDNAISDLKKRLLEKAQDDINQTYNDYSQIIYKIDEDSIDTEMEAELGDKVEEFEVIISAEVVVVAFDASKTADLAKQKFTSSLSENKELVSFDEENIIYTLDNYSFLDGTASVNATFEGKITIKEDSDIVDVNKLLGLNKDQVEVYLGGLSDIAGYEVKFSPSFLPAFMQKVPKLADRITIEIKK